MTHKNVLDRFRLDGKSRSSPGRAGAREDHGDGAGGSGRRHRAVGPLVEAPAAGGGEGSAAATGRRAAGFAADVTKLADVERLADEVEAELGPVDILVNNAGINIRGPIQQLTEADWDAVIDTNLKGPFLCARAFGPRMVSARLGTRRQSRVGAGRDRAARAAPRTRRPRPASST